MSPEWLPRREFENYKMEVINPMRKQLEGVASKSDLDKQTQTIVTSTNMRFEALAEERRGSERRIGWYLTGIGIFLTVVMIVLKLTGKG